MSVSRALAVVVCLALLPLPGAAAEGTEALVNRVIAVYGGTAALSRLATMRQTGRTASTKRGGAVGALTRIFQRPDKLRVEIAYPGEAAEVRILDGERGWRRNAEISGAPLHSAMVLQAARLALPLLLLDDIAKLEDLGAKAGPDGVRLRVLRLPLRDDLVLFVAIEVESGYIRHSRGVITVGGGPAMEFATTYSDFRHWEGVLVAGREEQYVMGRYIGHTMIDRVEFPESYGMGYFRP